MEYTANRVILRGSLAGLPAFSHEKHARRFYRFFLEVERLSGTADVLLMKTTDASAAGSMTHYPLRYDLMSTIYSVIGGETP